MRRIVLVLIAALVTWGGGCFHGDSSDDDIVLVGVLIFAEQPSDTGMGMVLSPAVQVHLRSHDGQLMTSATDMVTLSLLANPGGATLGGTLSVAAVGGIATFADLTVSSGGVGYVLAASVSGFLVAGSAPFNVSGAPAKLAFTSTPASVAAWSAFGATVEIQDLNGLRVFGATDAVTLSLASTPGDLLLHASGDATSILELINASGPSIAGPLTSAFPATEMLGMVWDPTLGLVRGTDRSLQFLLIDAASGDAVRYGDAATLTQRINGMAFNDLGQIRAVSEVDAVTHTVDLGTGVDSSLGTGLTISGGTVTGAFALARHPLTGVYFAVVSTSFAAGRLLVTVDMTTGVCTLVGSLGDLVTSLAFGSTGTLYAVTGDAAVTPETLFTVNTTTALMTSVLALGNGDAGESIVRIGRRLGGTLTVNAVDGLATFAGLYLDQPGNGYRLFATSGALAPGTSASINVAAAPAAAGTVEFSAATSSVAENDAGGTAPIDVEISAAQTFAVPVMIVVDGTSTASPAGGDVGTARAFQAIIPPGQTSVTINVPLVDDGLTEGSEDLVLRIFSARMASGFGANTTHTLTITDDD